VREAVQLKFPEDEAVHRITQLGLTPALLSALGLGMLQAGASAHPYGARSSAGYRRWDAGLAVFGEQLCPRNWRRELFEGLELIINPGRTVAISVNSSDENVGNLLRDPKARFKRGATVVRRVANNANQGDFFRGFQKVKDEEPTFQLWMLMHCTALGRLHLELGLPLAIEDDRRTITFSERLPVGVFGFRNDDGGLAATPTPPFGLGPVITILPR